MRSPGGKGLRLWDVSTGNAVRTVEGPVNSVVFSPDGKLLASGSGDKTIRLWDVPSVTEQFYNPPQFDDWVEFDGLNVRFAASKTNLYRGVPEFRDDALLERLARIGRYWQEAEKAATRPSDGQ